jgi:hypothetical protein
MSRFKSPDYSSRLLPVDLSRQLLPGTFEHALHYLLEHEIDLSEIEPRSLMGGVRHLAECGGKGCWCASSAVNPVVAEVAKGPIVFHSPSRNANDAVVRSPTRERSQSIKR